MCVCVCVCVCVIFYIHFEPQSPHHGSVLSNKSNKSFGSHMSIHPSQLLLPLNSEYAVLPIEILSEGHNDPLSNKSKGKTA